MSYFITLEGGEGAGKSTLAYSLAKKIEQHSGRNVVLTREPGGTVIGQKIRKILLENGGGPVDSLAELLLFSADRRIHLQQLILPALEKNEIVICDRYICSTIAYQGYARGLELEKTLQIIETSIEGKLPDLTLYLDISPETGLSRARERSNQTTEADSWNSFEDEKIEFHKKIREGFIELSKDAKYNFKTINAERTPEQVLENAWSEVKGLINA